MLLKDEENKTEKSKILEELTQKMRLEKYIEINLSEMDHIYKTDKQSYPTYRQKIKEELSESIYDGHLVVLNLDENDNAPLVPPAYPDL